MNTIKRILIRWGIIEDKKPVSKQKKHKRKVSSKKSPIRKVKKTGSMNMVSMPPKNYDPELSCKQFGHNGDEIQENIEEMPDIQSVGELERNIAESPRRPKKFQPWCINDIKPGKIAPRLFAWVIDRTLDRIKSDGWTVLWATQDEKWVPNVILQKKNMLMAVYVHVIWNHRDFSKINQEIIDRLIAWSFENDAIPVICNMGINGTLKKYSDGMDVFVRNGLRLLPEDGYLFYDCANRQPWSQLNYNPHTKKEISKWEKYEIAIRIVCNDLIDDGYEILLCNADPTSTPQIWASFHGINYHILVIPQIYMSTTKMSESYFKKALSFASKDKARLLAFKVTMASSRSSLVGETSEPICRGDEIDYIIEQINDDKEFD